MNTFSQGTANWKEATKNMTICAYNPVPLGAEVTLVVAPEAQENTEGDWPFMRAEVNSQSARLLRTLVTRRA
jgi:hypothetical protein